MSRKWVYWRSSTHNDPRVLAVKLDEDGRGHTVVRLHLPGKPEHHWSGTFDHYYLWRVSRAEALRYAGLKEWRVQV